LDKPSHHEWNSPRNDYFGLDVRQVVGLKSLGIYLPSILSISFLATGIKFGLLFFAIILVLGTVFRFLLVKLRLLYLPRAALILTLVSFITLLLIVFSANLGIGNLTGIAIFPMLMMIVLVERFINLQIERGWSEAGWLTIETLIISIFCYFLMVSKMVQNFIISYPAIILVLIIFNFLIGRWTGLRLTEYFRFQQVIKSK